MVHTRMLWAALLLISFFGRAEGQDEPLPKGADLQGFMAASEAVNAFVQAMQKEDLDALMMAVDVPWFQDGKKIVESKNELRELFRKPLEEKDFSVLKAEVEQVQQFKTVRDKASGTTGELLKKVARDEDLLFRMKIMLGSKTDGLMLLVRVSENGAKIIGLRD